jgi:protoheme IX farnesyltransferase
MAPAIPDALQIDRARPVPYIGSRPGFLTMRAGSEAISEAASRPAWTRASDFVKLTKPGLTSLVLFTVFIGFCTGTGRPVPLLLLCHTLAGAGLMAGGAGAFNMYLERELDARMKRTAFRPLASGRMRPGPALLFALSITIAGFVYLYVFVNPLTSLLSVIVFASYLFIYTPLKARTWLCTLVGAIPGALPVVMGWTAATASVSSGAALLFAIVFLWQFPHFYSIGWMYREDYARAGLPVLAVIDWSGRRTARQAILFIAVLVVFTLLPFPAGIAGGVYMTGAVALGAAFLACAVHFARCRDRASARHLFIVSALYLPALLLLMAFDNPAAR